MFSMAKQRVFMALFLMGFLLLGAAAAEARDTKGADRTVKGAVAGAAVGTVTQIIRGRDTGKELLKGAAVGTAVGAAVGAYGDYRQEKNAREDDHRYGRYDDRYRDGRRYDRDRYDDRYDDYRGYRRDARPRHRHDRNCRH